MIDRKQHIIDNSTHTNSPPNRWIYFDIETLGLSRFKVPILTLGLAIPTSDGFELLQWNIETPSDEKIMLELFWDKMPSNAPLSAFNGKSFDVPFINYRSEKHGIRRKIPTTQVVDLLHWSKATLKGLPNYRLKTVESALGFFREDLVSGKECIELYEQYTHSGDSTLLDTILMHNRDDILNMIPLAQKLWDYSLEKRIEEPLFLKWGSQIHWLREYRFSENSLFLKLECSCPTTLQNPIYLGGLSIEPTVFDTEVRIPIFSLDYPHPKSHFIHIDAMPGLFTRAFNEHAVLERIELIVGTDSLIIVKGVEFLLSAAMAL